MPDYAIEVDVGEASHKKEQEEVTATGKWPFGLHNERVEPISYILDTHPELQVRTEKGKSRRKIIVAV